MECSPIRTLQKNRNQYFLPVLAATCLFYSWYSRSVFLLFIALFYSCIFMFRKQYFLLALGGILSVGIVARESFLATPFVSSEQSQNLTIQIAADTIVVNGDLVKFDGKVGTNKIKCTYLVSSEQEKQDWTNRMNWQRQIKVKGTFVTPAKKTNQYAFDYPAYLIANRYTGQFAIEHIIQVRPLPMSIWRLVHQLRSWAIARVERYISPKIGYLVNGLLFGYRQVEFYDELTPFTQNGLLHLFSISGMHVYFFLGWVDWFFRRIGLSFQAQLGPFLVLSFLLACFFGVSSSILRAIFMYLLYWVGKEGALRLSGTDRYGIVLASCLLIEPRTLLQLSSQLSFAFSFFLLFVTVSVYTHWQKLLHAQVIPCISAPLLMYFFYEWPLLSGVFTYLLMPLFDVLLLPLATVLFLVCRVPLIGTIVENLLIILMTSSRFLLTVFPKIVLTSGQPSLLLIIICTVVGIWSFERKKYGFMVASCLLLPFLGSRLVPFEKVTFVDVGQGDAIVLQTKWNREVYVIDTGGRIAYERKDWQERKTEASVMYSLVPYLKGEGIAKIDGLFLTHGDMDHLGDADELMQAIKVENVYLGKGSLANEKVQALYYTFSQHVHFQEIATGTKVGKQRDLLVLSPEDGKGENNDSLVLYTRWANRTFLFTGDLEEEGERDFLSRYGDFSVDVLKVGHHGSKTSSSPEFIDSLTPKEAIISCGRNNRYKHPHQETLATLKAHGVHIFRTDQNGMIQYRSGLWNQRTFYLKK